MRKRFLIKPILQLKHLFWTLGIVLLCVVAGYSLLETALSNQLELGSLSWDQWLSLRTQLRVGAGVMVAILLAAVGIENYFFFHRVVGPIYALEKGLRRLAQGDFQDVTRIRESDEFGELIAAFEATKKTILHRIQSEERSARLLAAELDRLLVNATPETIGALRKRLQAIREQVDKKAA